MGKAKSKPSAKKTINAALRHVKNVNSYATDAQKRQTAYTEYYDEQTKQHRLVSDSTVKKWSKQKRRNNALRKNIQKLKKSGKVPSWELLNQLLDTIAVTESIVDETHTNIHNEHATQNRLYQKHGRICQSFSKALDSVRLVQRELETAQHQVSGGANGVPTQLAPSYTTDPHASANCWCTHTQHNQTIFPKDSKTIKLKRGRSKRS